jgi:hypothetical protein
MWIVAISASLISFGCIRAIGPEDVTRELSQYAGVDLRQEVGITVTRSGIWLAKKSLKWSDETEISLDGLRRVEVGVYEVTGMRDEEDRPALSLEQFPTRWAPWVRVQDEGEDVFVLVREGKKPAEIDGMLVVVTSDDEWVVVRMRGKLERIMEDAIRLALDQADKPELTERTLEEHDQREEGEEYDADELG